MAELEPDGLDGVIAIQKGSNQNLPPITTVPAVDEEHVSTLLEVLDSILQYAEGDEHLGSDGVSLHLFHNDFVDTAFDGLFDLFIYALLTREATYSLFRSNQPPGLQSTPSPASCQ